MRNIRDPRHNYQIVRFATRLFALLARDAPVGVIFRRGPSKQVLLIKWNLDTDTFYIGQWFRGRVYERRCDLSPRGDLLLYFAASYRKPYLSWSAISRPPYFTALALWPKGDGWGGGGQFLSKAQVQLNHRGHETTLAEGFSIPDWLSIRPFGDRPGWGEDDPVWSSRLQRDGWTRTAYPERTKDDYGAKIWIEYDPPIKWERAHPTRPNKYTLQMSILGINERDGAWYLTEHSLVREDGTVESIGRSEWADWSPKGDLLFSQSGCLFRLQFEDEVLGLIEASKQIADFSALEFQEKPASDEAREWIISTE